jgi:hypothetical protein
VLRLQGFLTLAPLRGMSRRLCPKSDCCLARIKLLSLSRTSGVAPHHEILTYLVTSSLENHQILFQHMMEGRANAQAVSRWLPTTAARVQTRV